MTRKLLLLILLFQTINFAQQPRSKAHIIERKNDFYDKIVKELDGKEDNTSGKTFKMMFEGLDLPKSADEFTQYWHNNPVTQGRTGTCWAFATTSYLESEVKRLTGNEVKLSEIYAVYWEYIEKVLRFIKERGESRVAEGSLSPAYFRILEKHGMVPRSAYEGRLESCPFYDHEKMAEEISRYLDGVRSRDEWNGEFIIATVRSIMDNYMTPPPTEFVYEGKKYSPQTFLTEYLRIDTKNYLFISSQFDQPYNDYVLLDVPDNWAREKDFYNITLDIFIIALKSAVRNGYTVCLDGDVSESGIDGYAEVAMIPTYDIPSEYIDEYARHLRFVNGSTTDDHLIHLVGYQEKSGDDWYLIKDSGSHSFNGPNRGYLFYHEDFVKLKMLFFVAHKDALSEFLK